MMSVFLESCFIEVFDRKDRLKLQRMLEMCLFQLPDWMRRYMFIESAEMLLTNLLLHSRLYRIKNKYKIKKLKKPNFPCAHMYPLVKLN